MASAAVPAHAIRFDQAPEASDFLFGSVLGQGSYAKVFHAQLKRDKMDMAVKVMDQSFIRKENKASFVITERKVMSRLAHPSIVKFYCSFRDNQSLYLAMELCRGGDLFGVIRSEHEKNAAEGVVDTACSNEMTQFYMAELVIALEYMHSHNVVHRDLKPDNLLLSEDGHLKVTDFGTAKDQEDPNSDVNQFCGTVSYVSPEVLHDKPATRACDLWALGCVIFQMFTGRTPFVAENDYLTFQVIINHTNDQLVFPGSVPEPAQDLISKLLVQEPSERLGAEQSEAGYAELKAHPFFDGIKWDALGTQTPPYTPPPMVLPEPRLDGASENWTVAEYFSDDAFSESTTEDLMSRRSRSSSSMRMSRPMYMAPDEVVRLEATVKVHSKMFKRTREVLLTDAPRLILLSSWSGKFKREIALTSDTKVNPIGPHTFDLISPSGTFRMTDMGNLTESWARAIAESRLETTRFNNRRAGVDSDGRRPKASRRQKRTRMGIAQQVEPKTGGSAKAPSSWLSDDDDGDEEEGCVLRYFTTHVMLRSEERAFLSLFDAPSGSVLPSLSLLGKAPTLVVLPPNDQELSQRPPQHHFHHHRHAAQSSIATPGVFTIVPAEGFDKEVGQPVYYGDPVTLVDQQGRAVGVVGRSPYAGHLAVEGHTGPLVFVLERPDHNNGRQRPRNSSWSSRSNSSIEGSTTTDDSPRRERSASEHDGPSLAQRLGFRRTRSPSLEEISGGCRVRIRGLVCAGRKIYEGACLMQQKFFSETSWESSSSEFLSLEMVVTTTAPNKPAQSEAGTAAGRKPSRAWKDSHETTSDRTTTGEFIGVLHSGLLHRRSDHTRTWKKRFFVLTHVAIHRFEPEVTLDNIETSKSRGDVLLRDCRCIRYEKFANPHELDIVLHNGKIVTYQATSAVVCAKWASVLSYAIENPQWVHTSDSLMTVWRSDAHFESPNCPVIDRIVVYPTGKESTSCCTAVPQKEITIIDGQPRWDEKLSLDGIRAPGQVELYLNNGCTLQLSMEDIAQALLQPNWICVETTTVSPTVDLQLDSPTTEILSPRRSINRRSRSKSLDSKPRFRVRLKYRADLRLEAPQCDLKSLLPKRSVVLTTSGLLLLACILARPSRCSWLALLIITVLPIAVLLLAAPILWQFYWIHYRPQALESHLHWFLLVLAVEVRPSSNQANSYTSPERNYADAKGESPLSVDGFLSSPDAITASHAAAVRVFRIENALNSILGRPQFSFFAIKRFFPNRFLPRDALGRRVLLLSMEKVDWDSLAAQNVSLYHIERYFLYLWEFIWSYDDLSLGVTHSQLVLVIDGSKWTYGSLFCAKIRVLFTLLWKTELFYSGRLAQIVIQSHSPLFTMAVQLFCKWLPASLQVKCVVVESIDEYVRPHAEDAEEDDEQHLNDFVVALLASYATVSIPSFTQREIDQATQFTKSGRLRVKTRSRHEVGTRALRVQSGAIEWTQVYDSEQFSLHRSNPLKEPAAAHRNAAGLRPSPSSPLELNAQQWRGSIHMQFSDGTVLLSYLHDPSLRTLWDPSPEQIVLLDTISSCEDVCFWSRRVPLLSSAGLCGGSGSSSNDTDAYFACVLRRIYEARSHTKGPGADFTVLWKTNSVQRVANNGQWHMLEDPYVVLCFVIESAEADQVGKAQSGMKISFWFQSTMPVTSKAMELQVAQRIQQRLRSLDTFLLQAHPEQAPVAPLPLN